MGLEKNLYPARTAFLDDESDESDESDEDDGDDETGEEEFEEILKAAESGDADSQFRSRKDGK